MNTIHITCLLEDETHKTLCGETWVYLNGWQAHSVKAFSDTADFFNFKADGLTYKKCVICPEHLDNHGRYSRANMVVRG